jgi:hypothetical protein
MSLPSVEEVMQKHLNKKRAERTLIALLSQL